MLYYICYNIYVTINMSSYMCYICYIYFVVCKINLLFLIVNCITLTDND